MRRFVPILALCTPQMAVAEWQAMTGAEIGAALEGRVLRYDNATQDFRASGKTLSATNGRDGRGNWRVEGDRFCSQWPPADLWACCDTDRQGDILRFVGQRDDITQARHAD